jgi:transposase
MNSKSFADFLRIALIGYTGYYLILDNVSFHKSRCVKLVLQEIGVTPIFIDPYCPEQNLIEEVFSQVKWYVRKGSPVSETIFDKYLRTAMRKQNQLVLTKNFHRSTQV